ncbi:hypothetical protein E2C01_068985 [Portunus trituberculatus]|uniref:Uncharacterized protein n=1 Tax=Portunus trituberculatus TaxID=210409 RepID=A0A5B7I101_PORTR|nr:hypothetical protein [Portunus trituberculatus]
MLCMSFVPACLRNTLLVIPRLIVVEEEEGEGEGEEEAVEEEVGASEKEEGEVV